ncbi:MAG: hypothetical protein KZQ95_06105 [Candidatus Thiodiazotropha sp. (ex Epidulcina cf. delphinae)]|nr:hypothetical protein [Candidatus Thiodiazotropha sp. (ex Epidulcina cf. delphinae)]
MNTMIHNILLAIILISGSAYTFTETLYDQDDPLWKLFMAPNEIRTGDGSAWPSLNRWDVSRGPFGGDRKTVVVDPADPYHAITDSVDRSGIWETRDGRTWRRASPPGASFASKSVRVQYLEEADKSARYLLVLESDPPAILGKSLFKLPLAAPADGPITEIDPWPGGASLTQCDFQSLRPGRLVAVDFAYNEPDWSVRIADGIFAISTNAGASWTRLQPGGGGTIFIPSSLSFTPDGNLLIGSALAGAPADLKRLFSDFGAEAFFKMVEDFKNGLSIPPAIVAAYNLDDQPKLISVNPADGTIVHSTDLPLPPLLITAHQAFPDIIWILLHDRVYRSADNGVTAQEISFQLSNGSGPLNLSPPQSVAVGLTVTKDPVTNAETLFYAINGSYKDQRGIYRIVYTGGEWRAIRVSDGPAVDHLDWPKASVVVAPSHPHILYAPYAEDGMWRSDAFGDLGSWFPVQSGLTGYNIFGVEEDPSNPDHVFGTAQNVVRVNDDRLASDNWADRFVSLNGPTCNLRGGIEVDPANPEYWLVAGGAGANTCLNGGVWLSEDAGLSWQRVLGSPLRADHPNNPQVYELLQHPDNADWILAASAAYQGSGNPGVFSSLNRGISFTEIVTAGDAFTVIALPDGSALAGGSMGLKRLTLSGNTVTVQEIPWSGGIVTAAVLSGATMTVGTADGSIYIKNSADLENPGGWMLVTDLGRMVSDLEADLLRPGEIYAGSDGNGIFRSSDNGSTWFPFAEGLESSERVIFDLEMSAAGDRIYAGTLGGLAVRALP